MEEILREIEETGTLDVFDDDFDYIADLELSIEEALEDAA